MRSDESTSSTSWCSAAASRDCRPRSAPHGAGCRVTVLTKAALGASATQYAQGGVAAVLAEPDVLADPDVEDGQADSPELHLADTLVAGAGLCDVDAVRVMVEGGPDARARAHRRWARHFDEAGDGLAFTREGGHTLPRIIHAGGDATGAEIERALVEAVAGTASEIRERWLAVDLLVDDGRAVGVRALDADAAERRGPGATHRRRDRRCRAVLRRDDEPGPVDRRRHRHGAARRGRGRRRRVHAVPSHRARPARRCRVRCSPRRCAARARSCATRTASRSWPTSIRWPTSRPATWSPARSPAGSSTAASPTSGWTPRPIADFADALPDGLAGLPGGRARSPRRLPAGGARGALPVGRDLHRSRRREQRSPGSGRAARRLTPACTARTGSRRTRCSTGWCSALVASTRSRRARTRRSRRVSCAALAPWAPGATPPVPRRRPRRRATSARSCSSS